ncbi:FAD:protein FMN transferase [candidate division KSB1 bacterium]
MSENFHSPDTVTFAGTLPHDARRFSHNAMATVYEIMIMHEDARYAGQAAHNAFCELDRLEQELSRFIENSDISRINTAGVNRPVTVGLDAFECLERCARLSRDTNSAFDATAGPLLQCWSGTGAPSEEVLARARERTGIRHVHLDRNAVAVILKTDGMCIDLGGFGKGYAVDRMVNILTEWDIRSALIHGGASSVYALGTPPGESGWRMSVRNPDDHEHIIAQPCLHNRAISGSGIRKGRHILDPRTGYPASDTSAAWVTGSTAADTDALSTAFMVMREKEIYDFCLNDDDIQALVMAKGSDGKGKITGFGGFRQVE